MEAVTWTLVGLLGAALLGSFGGFYYLGARIDAQGARLDARIDALVAKIDGQGARLDARLDNQEARLDRLGEQIAELTVAIRSLTGSVQAHLQRHAG